MHVGANASPFKGPSAVNVRSEHVLLIDDDVELCQLVAQYLTGEGFVVEPVHDSTHGVEVALEGRHDILVLDVMLPGMNGFEVLRRIRPSSRIPVIMLTARGEEVDKIVGLELGADDYLTKPFSPRELVARMRAVLRRTSAHEPASISAPESVVVADVELDLGSRSVTRGGLSVELTTVEFDLLAILLRAAGHVVSRERLVAEALGRPFTPLDRSVDTHVSNLRRKLGPGRDGRPRIKSVRGTGYQYVWAGTPEGH